jgi:hypothetical protein
MIPKDRDRASIDIWFQDEARFGQQNTTTRLLAENEHNTFVMRWLISLILILLNGGSYKVPPKLTFYL